MYPLRLKEFYNPPQKLYAKGNLALLNQTNIAFVGARSCSDYGRRNAKKFAKQLSNFGVNIVSGMAIGIDAASHQSCIENGGKTIAVLPCGFNNIYPRENIHLFHEILDSGGLVISEYSPETQASSETFVERNRIVAGLSICTIVIEASHRSGSSITAHLSMEQGRKVFCAPGNLESKYSVGTNRLIQEGANLLTSVNDIILQYPFLKSRKIKTTARKVPVRYSKLYRAITEISISIDELVYKLDMDISDLIAQLTLLEMDGYITQLPGGEYIRNE